MFEEFRNGWPSLGKGVGKGQDVGRNIGNVVSRGENPLMKRKESLSYRGEDVCHWMFPLVFLSGGTALHQVSSHIGYTKTYPPSPSPSPLDTLSCNLHSKSGDGDQEGCQQDVTYLITCFDSGGSSAILRDCISSYPAVGDIRNRVCSIAQGMLDGYQERHLQSPSPAVLMDPDCAFHSLSLVHLCKHRLPNDKECFELNLTSRDLHLALSSFTQQLLTSDLMESQPVAPSSSSSPSQRIFCQLIQLTDGVPKSLCRSCGLFLQLFLDELALNSSRFCFYNASIGNLILTGAYLQQERDLRAAINTFTHLLGICREHEPSPVVPVSTDHLTLGAHLRSGEIFLGQHLITGEKGRLQGLNSPIQSIFLIDYQPQLFSPSASALNLTERFATATPESMSALQSARVICYSVGSFFTSLLASVLPTGIATAIRQNHTAKKVFIPNMRLDSEMIGLSLFDATEILLQTLFKYDLTAPRAPESASRTEKELLTTCDSPSVSLSFVPSNYLSVILLDSLSLSLSSSQDTRDSCSLPYAHFGSSQEIAESIDRIQRELGITVKTEDICRLSGDEQQLTPTLEIDPEKLLETLRSL